MRRSRWLIMVLAVVLFAVGPAVALAAQTYGSSAKNAMVDYRSVEGKVATLNLNAKTLQVTPTDRSMSGPVRVAMNDQTVIHDGILPLTTADLKIGEDVNVMFSGSRGGWVADNIDVLEPPVPVAHYAGPGVR